MKNRWFTMSEPSTNLFPHLGKPVKDEYGRIVGTMASFLVTPGGRVNAVFIEHGDGRIRQYSSDQVKTERDEMVLYATLKMKATNFCNQIPLLWRKTQAIKDLNEKKKIPEDMYGDLHSSFEGALNQLKTEAESTVSEIDTEIENCRLRIKDLHSALINLEIEKEIGQIDEESYQTAMDMVKEGLGRVNVEKDDLESLKSKLSNILVGDTGKDITENATPEPESEPLATSLPEPPDSTEPESPVVVYVKNVDKSPS
jgi:hypothetical protein